MQVKNPSPDASAQTLAALIDAFVRRDLAAACACFSNDATYREAKGSPLHGRDAIAEHFARFAASGAAWRFEADRVIADGERACVIYRFTAEGDGGSQRERAGCATVSFDDHGRIAEWREYEG